MKRLILSLLGIMLFASPLLADVYSYKDEAGKTWFVDRMEAIPSRYRQQAEEWNSSPTAFKSKNLARSQTQLPATGRNSATRSDNKIEVFVTSWCPQCRRLESFLNKEGISYKRYDIEQSQTGKKKYNRLGYRVVPIVNINGEIIRGFDPNRILNLVNE